jgi:GNAT superfamily N-acetyltransferase
MSVLDPGHGPANYAWLKDISEQPQVRMTIPLFIGDIDDPDNVQIIALSTLTAESLYITYLNNGGSWELLSDYQLVNEPIVHEDGILDGVVSFVGEDALEVESRAKELGTKIKDIWRLGFMPYYRQDNRVADQFRTARQSCDCQDVFGSTIGKYPGHPGVPDISLLACHECMQIHGFRQEGKKSPLATLFSDEWQFGSGSLGEIVESGDNDEYCIKTTGSDVGRAEKALIAMNSIGGSLSNAFSPYNPEYHSGLLWVKDGELTGYLTWEDTAEIQVLRQIFVRSTFRRTGIATKLVRTWCTHFQESEVFYVDEPNEKSRAMLDSLENRERFHYQDIFPIRAVGNTLSEGNKLPAALN